MSNLLQLQSDEFETYTQLPALIQTPQGYYPCEQQIERSEIQNLKREFEYQLNSRSAFQYGLCPVRSEIHRELFDELVREVYLDQAETGAVLARVRDEAHMTVCNYQTLYETTLDQVQNMIGTAEENIVEMRQKMDSLIDENRELKHELMLANAQLEQMDLNSKYLQQVAEKRITEDKQYLNKQIEQLQHSVEALRQHFKENPEILQLLDVKKE
ncbi:Axonemal_dynein light chain [Hexamita inflata]|uniref:Axonemal dynein light chain n=1 Tax=Hexamita inflata TaxID=28002 RepID=A0AA86NS00_9EUKA|nr:Axonemal dynein light chain [Hexamita inflata]